MRKKEGNGASKWPSLEVAREISNAYADEAGRPFQNIRVRHTIVLDDPFDDPPGAEH